MTITAEMITHLNGLAYLKCNTIEQDKLAMDVATILDLVEQLTTIETDGIAPLFHPLELHQRFRDDTVSEANCLQALAAIAPDFSENVYWVPKVIDDK